MHTHTRTLAHSPMTEAEKRSKDSQPIVACTPQRHEVSLLTGGASTDAAGARKATKTYTFDQVRVQTAAK